MRPAALYTTLCAGSVRSALHGTPIEMPRHPEQRSARCSWHRTQLGTGGEMSGTTGRIAAGWYRRMEKSSSGRRTEMYGRIGIGTQ